jgi:lysine 2,3-aminomutase
MIRFPKTGRYRLPENYHLSGDESRWFQTRRPADRFVPNRYWYSLMTDDADDPLRKQAVPTIKEKTVLARESDDPLMESRYRITPRVIHRYRDRVLLLVTDRCALYCRHCFRRYYTGKGSGVLTGEELRQAAEYLKEHREVREVLLSGGDPLTLPDSRIRLVLETLKTARPDIRFRLCTRIPSVLPFRVTEELVYILKQFRPFWTVIHVNHPREITAGFRQAVSRFLDSGIPVLNQTVLLRGINDRPDILKDLCLALTDCGVKPYYLLQGDLAEGTSHFRISVKKAMKLAAVLERDLSGIAVPRAAVDLPGGGGKIPLSKDYLAREEKDALIFRSRDGREYAYPLEEETGPALRESPSA